MSDLYHENKEDKNHNNTERFVDEDDYHGVGLGKNDNSKNNYGEWRDGNNPVCRKEFPTTTTATAGRRIVTLIPFFSNTIYTSLFDNDREMNTTTNSNMDGNYDNDDDTPTPARAITTRQHQQPKQWFILLLGQIIAFLMSSAGAAQGTLHLNCHISIPTLSTAFVYILISFCIIPYYYKYNYQHSTMNNNNSSGGPRTNSNELEIELNGHDTINNNDVKENEQNIRNNNVQESCNSTQRQLEAAVLDDIVLHSSVSIPSSTFSSQQPQYSLGGIVPLHSPLWAYGLIALLDVEANYVTVLAFQYTTITSVNLFDALAIPTAMVLSRIALRRSYVPVHIVGALLCMMGIVVNVMTDYESDKKQQLEDDSSSNNLDEEENEEYPHRIWGDLLSILGGLLWGCNNVVQEYLIQNSGVPYELLGMLGLFGTLISIVQISILERDDLHALFSNSNDNDGNVDAAEGVGGVCPTSDKIWLIVVYVFCVGSVYLGGAYFLLYSEAALYNLSLLTSDVWTVIFSVVAERIIPPPMFFIAMFLIVGGVIIYESGPSPILVVQADNDGNNTDASGDGDGHACIGQVELPVYQTERS